MFSCHQLEAMKKTCYNKKKCSKFSIKKVTLLKTMLQDSQKKKIVYIETLKKVNCTVLTVFNRFQTAKFVDFDKKADFFFH